MKRIFLLVLSILSVGVFSQKNDSSAQAESSKNITYGSKKGTIKIALQLGKSPIVYTNSKGSGSFIQDPSNSSINSNYPDTKGQVSLTYGGSLLDMAGLEGEYFISDKISINLGVGLLFRVKPSSTNIPSVKSSDGYNTSLTPSYEEIMGEEDFQAYVTPGVNWYYKLKSPRLLPYIGFNVPIQYSRYSMYNPYVDFNGTSNVSSLNYGKGYFDLLVLGIQGSAGLDYYLTQELYIGVNVKPISYYYLLGGKKPRAGGINRKSNNHTLSLFGQYLFKLGFKLN